LPGSGARELSEPKLARFGLALDADEHRARLNPQAFDYKGCALVCDRGGLADPEQLPIDDCNWALPYRDALELEHRCRLGRGTQRRVVCRGRGVERGSGGCELAGVRNVPRLKWTDLIVFHEPAPLAFPIQSLHAQGNATQATWKGTRMIDIEDMIKKQIALYEAYDIRARHEQRPGRGKEGDLTYGPYLLISREKGAGGNAVAEVVRKRLGWQVFDNQIVDQIAQKANVRRQLIESLDERTQETIHSIVTQILHPAEIGTAGYLTHLKEIVLALGHQGDVIIIGRGARYMLPTAFGVNVRFVAPIAIRTERIAQEQNLSLTVARAQVETADRDRAKLIRNHFKEDVANPLGHDLTINTAELTIEAAAEVALTALQQKLSVKPKQKAMSR
jgi:Cytidylate kinase-like family